MNTFLKNTILKLYNPVSAPVIATCDTLAERLQSVRETASLLYNRMVENLGYGKEELKDILEKEAEEEPAVVKEEEEQRQGWWWAIWNSCKNRISARRKTREGIQSDWKFKQPQHKDNHGQHHTTHWEDSKGNLFI